MKWIESWRRAKRPDPKEIPARFTLSYKARRRGLIFSYFTAIAISFFIAKFTIGHISNIVLGIPLLLLISIIWIIPTVIGLIALMEKR